MFGVTLTGANMLFMTQYLQFVLGLSPLNAGVWMLPTVGSSIAGFLLSPVLARRIRPAYLIGAGMLIAAGGALLLTQVQSTSSAAIVVAGWALCNLGAAPLVSLATGLVVGSVPPEKAGSAAAISETSSEFAFAFGIASLGSLGTAIYRVQFAGSAPASIPAAVLDAARESIVGAVAAAANVPEPVSTVLLVSAHDAFASGLHAAAAVSAVVFVAVGVLTLTMLRHVRPLGAAAPEERSDTNAVPAAPTLAAT
jgi:MFS transporter, DHA2 family, multidrug resistance protein